MRQIAVRVKGVMTAIVILVVMHSPYSDEDSTSLRDQHSIVVVIYQKVSYCANTPVQSNLVDLPLVTV